MRAPDKACRLATLDSCVDDTLTTTPDLAGARSQQIFDRFVKNMAL